MGSMLVLGCNGGSGSQASSGGNGPAGGDVGNGSPSSPSSPSGASDAEAEAPSDGGALEAAAAYDGDGGTTPDTCVGPAGSRCWALSPKATDPKISQYTATHYVLRPAQAAPGNLVLFLHGFGDDASAFWTSAASTSETNLLATVTKMGYRVLALTHRSVPNVRPECGTNDACFLPSRRTFVRGVVQPGAAATIGAFAYQDGIESRLIRALVTLRDTVDPGGNWGGSYLTPANCDGPAGATTPCSVVWSRVVVVGHSQGGGFATVIGKDYAAARVVLFASPTDYWGDVYASPPKFSVPSYTLASTGLATAPGGGRWRGLVHTEDEFYLPALMHFGADRLNGGTWSLTTSASSSGSGKCLGAGDPHTCVIQDASSFGATWQSLFGP